MIRDAWDRVIVTEQEVCDFLYTNPAADLTHLQLADPSMHNAACEANYSEFNQIKVLENITCDPKSWHQQNQLRFAMPDSYKSMDIASYVLGQCHDDAELERCGVELIEYASRDLLPLLSYLKYLVDTMALNNIVWGVGRGSSVSSYVLYKLGVHRIDSIKYDLDFAEFMRD